jgi:hypothetical protein
MYSYRVRGQDFSDDYPKAATALTEASCPFSRRRLLCDPRSLLPLSPSLLCRPWPRPTFGARGRRSCGSANDTVYAAMSAPAASRSPANSAISAVPVGFHSGARGRRSCGLRQRAVTVGHRQGRSWKSEFGNQMRGCKPRGCKAQSADFRFPAPEF